MFPLKLTSAFCCWFKHLLGLKIVKPWEITVWLENTGVTSGFLNSDAICIGADSALGRGAPSHCRIFSCIRYQQQTFRDSTRALVMTMKECLQALPNNCPLLSD